MDSLSRKIAAIKLCEVCGAAAVAKRLCTCCYARHRAAQRPPPVFYVYCWTNIANGKKYIGKGCGNRAIKHLQYASHPRNNDCPAFYAAVRKYGAGSFQLSYLALGLDDDLACTLEEAAIAAFGTMNRLLGYNLTSGGDGHKKSEETRARMRKPKTDSFREKISAILKGRKPTVVRRGHIKLTRAQAVNVRFLRVLGAGHADLASWFGLSLKTVSSIVHSRAAYDFLCAGPVLAVQ